MEHIRNLVQQRVMTADDHQGIAQLFQGAEQTNRYLRTGHKALQSLGNLQNAVGLHKGGHHTAATA